MTPHTLAIEPKISLSHTFLVFRKACSLVINVSLTLLDGPKFFQLIEMNGKSFMVVKSFPRNRNFLCIYASTQQKIVDSPKNNPERSLDILHVKCSVVNPLWLGYFSFSKSQPTSDSPLSHYQPAERKLQR